MQYMGSKRRIAKEIIPFLVKNRKKDQYFVDVFVGGANLLDKIENPRIGNDNNRYLIALLIKLQQENFNPPHISEEFYMKVKENRENYEDWLVGFCGFSMSFASKFFRGFAKNKKGTDYFRLAVNNLRKQQPFLKGIEFTNMDYRNVSIPDNSIVYCDPPYKGTERYYKNSFDYPAFYEWCKLQKENGHEVFISEYWMPDEFICIWKKELSSNLTTYEKDKPKAIEKLFTV